VGGAGLFHNLPEAAHGEPLDEQVAQNIIADESAQRHRVARGRGCCELAQQ